MTVIIRFWQVVKWKHRAIDWPVGAKVTWKLCDNDIPFGDVGTVVEHMDGQDPLVIVSFANGNFGFSPNSLVCIYQEHACKQASLIEYAYTKCVNSEMWRKCMPCTLKVPDSNSREVNHHAEYARMLEEYARMCEARMLEGFDYWLEVNRYDETDAQVPCALAGTITIAQMHEFCDAAKRKDVSPFSLHSHVRIRTCTVVMDGSSVQ